ncbi:SRPBCC family protein [Sporichthya sp.]|uniref:SRPBCC family protein n=1 Tax=Sporichthya sp. TaxID=65475 RepID=UPI0017C992F2|nr:SRPBCC family protein [Sporichthya sp.]MBA3742474.1 SRPBCC family protein [Sporichthya sp.]
MTHFQTTVPSTWTKERTFAYLADFTNVAEWDPSISKSELTGGAAGEPGATYDVTFSVAGVSSTLPYRAEQVRSPDSIVMKAETDAVVSLDTITIDAADGGVLVTYRAELTLKGARKLAEPLADFALHRTGDKAAEQLTQKLAN